MKTIRFFIIACSALLMLSCNNDKKETSVDKQVSEKLLVMGLKSETSDNDQELVFSGEDIKFFNVRTKEIVFNNLEIDELKICLGIFTTLKLYLNENLLFDIAVVSPFSGSIYNDLTFYLYESKFYLDEGYPSIDESWSESLKENMQKERELSAKLRQREWKMFIQYLSDNGKLAE